MTPFIAEILGTFILILLGDGVSANATLNKSYAQGSGWVVITFGWGFAVFMGVAVAAPYSGAHINPAVTLGLAFAGKFSWSLVPTYILAQFIGAMLGAFVVWINFYSHYKATPGEAEKLGTFCTGPAIKNYPINFINELIGTFVLVLVVLYFTGPVVSTDLIGDLKLGLGSIGALPVAFLVVAIGMSLGGTTGYAINPARDLGPRIIHALVPMPNKGSSNWNYSWIPVFGPIVGAAVAAGLYLVLL